MKKGLLVLAISLPIIFGAVGCHRNNPTPDPPVPPTPPINEEIDVKVTYYIDYNAEAKKEAYHSETVKNGSKLVEPAKPTVSPFPEFKTFIGWSTYQIINEDSQLWNFSVDKVTILEDQDPVLTLYGIWGD